MKKIKLISIIFICLFMVGCGKNSVKESIDSSKFVDILNKYQFNLENKQEEYSNIKEILESYTAILDDIEISYFKYDSYDYVTDVHQKMMETFSLYKSSGATPKISKGKNYYKYVLISNNFYMVTSKIDNTLIYCKTSINNLDKVEAIFNELEY